MNKVIKNINYKELEENRELLKEIPVVNKNELKFLWRLGTYDGMLSGVCLYNGKPHYLSCFHDYHLNDYGTRRNGNRIFAIVELSDKQFKTLKKRHDIFSSYVGYHTKFTKDNKYQNRYPTFSKWYFIPNSIKELMTKYYYKNHKHDIEIYNEIENNKVVACFSNCNWDKQTILVNFLKDKIKDLIYEQKGNKLTRKTDSFYNSVCYYEGQKLRAHLIAYGLLRNKQYSDIEKKNDIVFEITNSKWNFLYHKIVEICNLYSIEDKWTKELIINILSRKEELNDR